MTTAAQNLFGQALRGNRGKALESAVIASAGRWMRIRKMGAEAKWLGSHTQTDLLTGAKTKHQNIIQKKGPVDYLGCNRLGRFVCFDAKECALIRGFPVGSEPVFKPHQRRFLIDHGEFNAISGLVLESMAKKRFYWLDWKHLVRVEPSIFWQDPRLIDLGDTFHAIRFDLVPGIVEATA